jgi:hypothetical protein
MPVVDQFEARHRRFRVVEGLERDRLGPVKLAVI